MIEKSLSDKEWRKKKGDTVRLTSGRVMSTADHRVTRVRQKKTKQLQQEEARLSRLVTATDSVADFMRCDRDYFHRMQAAFKVIRRYNRREPLLAYRPLLLYLIKDGDRKRIPDIYA